MPKNENTPLTTAIAKGDLEQAKNLLREVFGFSGDEFILNERVCVDFIHAISTQVKDAYLYNNLERAIDQFAEERGYGSAVQVLQDSINRLISPK